ncbi:MAG TPA: glycosyltransferase family A protein [Pyrinomonadaceae bacterium]|nr:glycosyltransferase family A protein [Pyrinomonadaceae bacterium]
MIKRAGHNSAERTPAVTVVIAAYNSAQYISQALDSVKAQTFTDYEVIVVNDGSDDREELERILEAHPLSIIYLSQKNGGVSAARNAAIRIASGEFYAQLDADDQWTPDYLEFQLKVLADNPDVALVYPNATIINDANNGGVEFMKVTPSEGEVNFVSLVRQECTVMTCVTARMSAIKKAGMFDESLRRCEDFDLWVRIVKNVGRITYHRRVLALYRRHAGSLSSDRVPMVHSQLAVLEKCSNMPNLTVVERAVLDHEIHQNRGMLSLFEGKRALSAGAAGSALVHFTQANEHLRSKKLVLVNFLLRHVPRLVVWTFGKRERLLLSKRRHEPPTVAETRGA